MDSIRNSSNDISGIVSSVKNGKIGKSEALSELRGILEQSGLETTGFGGADDRDEINDDDEKRSLSSGSSGVPSRFSQEDRRLLINKLIDAKKQKAMSQGHEFSRHIEGYENSGENFELEERSPNSNENSPSSGNEKNSWDERNEIKEPSLQMKKRHDFSNSIKSTDDAMVDARSNRIAQAEAVLIQEMFKECTFQPKIKSLPNSYGAMKDVDTPFHARVTRWQKDKEMQKTERKKSVDKNVFVDCTFQPRINRNSEKAVKEIRGNIPQENINDRLYKNHEMNLKQRAMVIQEELRRERREEDLQCTFQPQLVTDKSKYADVSAKFEHPQKTSNQSEEHPDLKHCTFTPKVKGIASSMSSAKLYVSAKVVDRLTRPIQQPAAPDTSMTSFDVAYGSDRNVMDMSSFLGSLGGNIAPPVSSSSASLTSQKLFQTPNQEGSSARKGVRLRPSSAPRERTSTSVAGDNASDEIKQKHFEEFLGRQRQSKIRKERRVEEVKHAVTPNFKPQLCQKSLDMSEQHYQGDFLDRIERHVLKRVDSENRRKSAANHPNTKGCTFQPQITQKSEKMRARSVYEMSRGDLLRKETNHRMLKLRREQEEVSTLTFQPEISKKAQNEGRSKLKITEDPQAHLEWHKEKLLQRADAHEAELKSREVRELESCTFAPETIDCPAYVKRIAKSMAVIKQARESPATPKPQPLWR